MGHLAPDAPTDVVRVRMSRQRRGDTRPEVALRKALHARGLRFRVARPVPGMPRRTIDVAFPRRRVAVFVDGCFWHGCPDHCQPSKHNTQWWADKLAGNAARDAETAKHLTDLGWTVVRIWEHEAAAEAADRVHEAIRSSLAG